MSTTFLLLFFFFTITCNPTTTIAQTPAATSPQPSDFADIKLFQAYQVIQRFKSTITCDPQGVTATWTGAGICQGGNYRGFFCESPPYNASAITVAGVDFNGFGLCAPTIAGFVDQMPDLAIFHVNSNNFTGIVPDLSNLPFLFELDLSNNLYSTRFPSDVSQLLYLDLRFNAFTGTLPPSVFSGNNLDVLFLNNNNFNQPLPSTLGSTPAAYITLANNAFTGSIPRTIANSSASLAEILLLNNQLSGCLPFEIGFLSQATVFDAGGNRITGPIPYSFSCLAKIEQLNLAGNFLYGEVPELVCALPNLQNLSLSSNYLTMVGPKCRQLIRKGVLDVRGNCIPGLPMQRTFNACVRFYAHAYHCPLPSTYYYVPCHPSCNGTANDTGWGGNGVWNRFGFGSRVYSSPGAHLGFEIGGRP